MPTVCHKGFRIAVEHPAVWVDRGERIVRDVVDCLTNRQITDDCLCHLIDSRDRLISINGAPLKTWPELRAKLQSLRMGDTVQVRVQRAQPFDATVVVAGFERPTVRIERLPNATVAQRRLAEGAIF